MVQSKVSTRSQGSRDAVIREALVDQRTQACASSHYTLSSTSICLSEVTIVKAPGIRTTLGDHLIRLTQA